MPKSLLTKEQQIAKMVKTRKERGNYVAWNKGGSNPAIKGEKHTNWKGGDLDVTCHFCKEVFKARRKGNRTHKFCSKTCANKGAVRKPYNKGKHVTNAGSYQKGHGGMVGSENPRWMGGGERFKCEVCNKVISFGAKNCKQHSALTGDKNPRWKGGDRKALAVVAQQKREAMKKGNGGSYTLEEWNNLLERCEHMCLCCKRTEPEVKLTVDHIMPISKGGRNDIQNIQPLCFSCNARKNAKHIDYISEYFEVKQHII